MPPTPRRPSFGATVDNTPPVITATVITPIAGSPLGYVKQGTAYYVYAAVSDAGAGVSSVTVDVSTVTTGQTAAALTTTGGPWTVGGVTYTYRSASITATTPLAEGAKAYTVSATDNATNIGTLAGSVTVDNTAPVVSAATIAPTGGSALGGFIKQAGTYYVYATATDVSGVASLTANVTNVTTGQTLVALTTTGGPWTVGATTYTYRSASMTANAVLAAGAKTYTFTATDNLATAVTTGTFSVTVDNTNPAVTASIIAKASGTVGVVTQAAGYYVYANASDATAGISSLTANVSTISTGQTAVAMSTVGGPWTVNAVSYSYRSTLTTANASLTQGALLSYSVTATDNASNTATGSYTVTVDNFAAFAPSSPGPRQR